MSRWHVADAGTLEAVRQAINSTKPNTGLRVIGGVAVPVDLVAECARIGIEPGQLVHTSRLVLGGDGTAALELPDADTANAETVAAVAATLGRTIRGTPIPSAASLVQVARAREHSQLPTGVRDVLDDRYVDSELAEGDTPGARGRVNAELQGRAAAALARWDARKAQAALERAMGIGLGSAR